MSDQPHDRLFNGVFAESAPALALLRGLLPSPVAGLVDFTHFVPLASTLVGRDLTGRYPDRVFETRFAGMPAVIQFLIEHQCTSPAAMPVRVAGSGIRTIEKWTRRLGTAGGIPLVIPIVVYHGVRPWSAPRRLSAMTRMTPEHRSMLAPFIPDAGYVLIDLRGITEEEIMRRVGVLDAYAAFSLLALKTARLAGLMARLAAWMKLIRTVYRGPGGKERVAFVVRYFLEVNEFLVTEDLERTLAEGLGRGAESSVMTLAEKWRKEGEARGEARGEALGEVRGRASALTRVLRTRFGSIPEELLTRLQNADSATLDCWLDRALTARELGEVFLDT